MPRIGSFGLSRRTKYKLELNHVIRVAVNKHVFGETKFTYLRVTSTCSQKNSAGRNKTWQNGRQGIKLPLETVAFYSDLFVAWKVNAEQKAAKNWARPTTGPHTVVLNRKLRICIISEKGDNLMRFTQIFDQIFLEISFPFDFHPGISRIFSWKVCFSELQQFPDFLKLFHTICPRFENFGIFGQMENAHGLLLMLCNEGDFVHEKRGRGELGFFSWRQEPWAPADVMLCNEVDFVYEKKGMGRLGFFYPMFCNRVILAIPAFTCPVPPLSLRPLPVNDSYHSSFNARRSKLSFTTWPINRFSHSR